MGPLPNSEAKERETLKQILVEQADFFQAYNNYPQGEVREASLVPLIKNDAL